MSWRWEQVDQDQLDAWQAGRHAPRAGLDVWRGFGWAAVLSTPLWVFLWVCGRLGGVW